MAATRKTLVVLGLIVGMFAGIVAAKDKKQKHGDASQTPAAGQIPEDKQIVHALNRFTFGVRPGDVERVRAMGLDKWFDEQLHPDKINDSALEARIAPFHTLKMSTREMVESFPDNQILKAVQNGKISMPRDSAKKAIYESRMVAMEERQQKKADGGPADTGSSPSVKPSSANADAAANSKSKPDISKSDMSMSSDAEASPDPGKARQKRAEEAMYADLNSASASASASMLSPSPSARTGANTPGFTKTARNEAAEMAADPLLQLDPEDRYNKLMKMPADQRLELLQGYKGGKSMKLVEGMKPEHQETLQAMISPQLVVDGELAQAKLLRDIYSDRQLDEVMTDFWYNHFNVFVGKGPDHYMITAYERDVIRPHALGKFKDLLIATAKSPAMLFYLDNWQSIGPNSDIALYGPGGMRVRRDRYGRKFPVRQRAAKNRSGLNENYAREVMELHTLGVDGGYNQKDVTELAKVLTGWGIEQPQRGGDFKFNERAHEPGAKYVLGHKIGEHGEKEGVEMLEILAHHPSTAKFISRKLAMRFVSDNPPQSLIDKMAETFHKKDGDIREVLKTMFNAPEFWSTDAYRAKVKTPLEFVASSVRASGVDIQNALPLVQFLNRMGMPLYGMQPPTGYSMKADAWVNSSALLNRMNFALQLGSGRLPGTSLDQQALLHGANPPDPEAALAVLENDILAGDVSAQTHQVILKQLNDPKVTQRKFDDPNRAPNYGAIAGLIMGSPEFQRR
jgi:uncharacterized protein (DUF1800 family)